ncbi:MAG: hypothetical protein PHD40_03745 [Syntrophomonadaceae bacterium]|nr:hypothetical protein [Syntrophomonadaceae bacterium]
MNIKIINLGKALLCFILTIGLVLSVASSSPVYAAKLSTQPTLSLSVGEVGFILVRGLPNTGFPDYKSSKPSVATVDTDQYNAHSFRIEALSKGVTIIKFTVIDDLSGEKDTTECVVTVTGATAPMEPIPDPVVETPDEPEAEVITDVQEIEEEIIYIHSITLEPTYIFLNEGEHKQLKVTFYPLGATGGEYIIESIEPAIAMVWESGKVLGVKAGYTEIIAQPLDLYINGKRVASYSQFYAPNMARVFVIGDDKVETASVLLDTLWVKTKEFIIGESFKVNTPTGGGTRG